MENENKTVVLIDDDLLLLDMYKRALTQEGFNVVTAQNGKDGYKKIKEIKPNLIITDIVMPKEDGFYVIEKVKKNKEILGIPLIALTNLDSDEDKKEALRLGADNFFLKAKHTPSQLMEEIKKIII